MSDKSIDKNFIGEWRSSDDIAENINPSDIDNIVSKFYMASEKDTNDAIDLANGAKEAMAKMPIQKKGEILNNIAHKLLAKKDELGTIISQEAGKPLKDGIDEVKKSAEFFSYFATMAISAKGAYMRTFKENTDAEVINEPVGTVGIITAWNYPMAIPAWKIAPAIAYGNSIVFKASSTTPKSAYLLSEILATEDLPLGGYNYLTGSGKVIGSVMAASSKIDAITFTGSNYTGKQIAKQAIDHMTKLQLEMGSKNSIIILDDADIDMAANLCVQGAYNATGQKCTSTARFIILESIYKTLLEKIQEKIKQIVVGNALNPKTHMGPIINETKLKSNLDYIELGKKEGANLLMGGDLLERDTKGYYFSPALFESDKSDIRINQEEMFAPIACAIKVKNYEEALNVLNDTHFGISGAIVTNSIKHAMHFKHNAKVGNVMINLPTAGMDNHIPFGGKKSSSYGSREKSYAAETFFTSSKTAYIKY